MADNLDSSSGSAAKSVADFEVEIKALRTRRQTYVNDQTRLQSLLTTLQRDYDALEKQVNELEAVNEKLRQQIESSY